MDHNRGGGLPISKMLAQPYYFGPFPKKLREIESITAFNTAQRKNKTPIQVILFGFLPLFPGLYTMGWFRVQPIIIMSIKFQSFPSHFFNFMEI